MAATTAPRRARRALLRAAPVTLALAALGAPLALGLPACRHPQGPGGPLITARWEDNFNRAELGGDWNATGNMWSIQDGHVRVANARNHPLWLRRRLPRNVRVEFDAWSNSPNGDIKCEIFGDGHSAATEASYTATSYVVIFGGWFNRFNVIARMDEHAPDRRQSTSPHVVPGQHYHWVIERRGNRLTWALDGTPMLEWDDPEPLTGAGHEYFAFNNWAVELGFDNVVITPL
jgi:hypothetical protein